jgi:membrane associated rhomboid family serine protease
VTPDDPGRGQSGRDTLFRRPDPFTLGVLVVCAAIEFTLQLADFGVIDVPRLRFVAYTYGGFWPGLLDDWRPNFAGQPLLMFLTYSVFHGGIVHFAVNMLTLLSLGAAVSDRAGTARYAAIYVASILGGAIAYGLLAPGITPMVGASGALFGLAGALLAWDTAERRALHLSLRPILRVLAFLVGMNLVLWWAMSGQLAWQTHLGGFLAGAAAAALLGERKADGDGDPSSLID